MTDYNVNFNKLDVQLKELQNKSVLLAGNDSDENSGGNNLMNFDDDADESTGFLDSEMNKSGKKINSVLKKSLDTSQIARGAMVKLRG